MSRSFPVLLFILLSAALARADSLSLIASRYLAGDVGRVLGVGEVAERVRASGSSVLVLDLGGALSPAEQAFDHERQGSLTVDVMNRAGYAAWFLGDRDLVWSDRLSRFLRRSEFPVIAANLHRPETGRHLFQVQPYAIVRAAGLRIGLVGLTASGSGTLAVPPVEAARYYVSLVDPRSDVVVVVNDADTTFDDEIAGVGGVDLVLSTADGPDVRRTETGWIVSTGPAFGLWGVDLAIEDGGIASAVASEMTIPSPDPADVREALLGWTAELEGEPVSLATVIGRSEGGFRAALTSPLGYYVADLMRASAEADGALVRTDHFPGDFVTGDITVYDLFRAYPMPYTVGVATVKGADLKSLLALSAGELTYYPSGISVVYTSGEDGGHLADAAIGGKPIDPRVTYTVAIEKGAHHPSLPADTRVRDTAVLVRDLLGRRIRTSESVVGVVDGRIQRR